MSISDSAKTVRLAMEVVGGKVTVMLKTKASLQESRDPDSQTS